MVRRNSITQIQDNFAAFIDAYDEAMLLLENSIKTPTKEEKYRNDTQYEKVSIRKTEEGFELTPVMIDRRAMMNKRANSKTQIQHFFTSLIEHKKSERSKSMEMEITNEKSKNNNTSLEDNEECSWADGAETVSKCILAGVNLLKHRIEHKIEDVSREIEDEGEIYKESIKEKRKIQEWDNDNDNKNKIIKLDPHMNEIVILTSGKVNKASHKLRDGTTTIALGIRSIATNKVVEIVDEMEEAEIGKLLIPNEENREILAAFGKVALTALGAAQISYETLYDTTETVALKSNSVAADVVSCKYGSTAGKVVENTGDSIYNTFRAFKLFALFNPDVMAVSVVKYTGKVKLPNENK